jgi:hypothetical protein
MVTTTPSATLAGAELGWHVAVKAVNAAGMEGWDWARTTVRAADTPGGAFWNALQMLCGRAFSGAVTRSVPPDTVFSRQSLVMHVRECKPDEIRIPFHVGEDRSRTWIITGTKTARRTRSRSMAAIRATPAAPSSRTSTPIATRRH